MDTKYILAFTRRENHYNDAIICVIFWNKKYKEINYHKLRKKSSKIFKINSRLLKIKK